MRKYFFKKNCLWCTSQILTFLMLWVVQKVIPTEALFSKKFLLNTPSEHTYPKSLTMNMGREAKKLERYHLQAREILQLPPCKSFYSRNSSAEISGITLTPSAWAWIKLGLTNDTRFHYTDILLHFKTTGWKFNKVVQKMEKDIHMHHYHNGIT